jgi:hypothetical protein
MRALPHPTLPLPADVGNWFGVPAVATYGVPEYRYAEPSLLDARSQSLSSTESYVTPVFEASHYSWNTATSASPESCVGGVLEVPHNELVGSNFDPSLHTDKFWLKQESHVAQQYVAEPLSRNEAVVKEEVDVPSLLDCTDFIVSVSGPCYPKYCS